MLHYLFSNLIQEEIRRDEAFRFQLQGLASSDSDTGNTRPTLSSGTFLEDPEGSPLSTPYASDQPRVVLDTSGFRIGAVTPGISLSQTTGGADATQARPTDTTFLPRKSAEDYFSAKSTTRPSGEQPRDNQPKTPQPGPTTDVDIPTSPTDPTNVSSPKETSTSFGKRLKSTFTPKKSTKSLVTAEEPKSSQVEEKDFNPDQKVAENIANDAPATDNMLHVIREIRRQYVKELENSDSSRLKSRMTPALPSDAPVLDPPTNTAIIIQEDHPGSGGVTDLFEGYRDQLGRHADFIEKIAPRWLGNLLLKVSLREPLNDLGNLANFVENIVPEQLISKVSFVLKPYQQLLPVVTAEEGFVSKKTLESKPNS